MPPSRRVEGAMGTGEQTADTAVHVTGCVRWPGMGVPEEGRPPLAQGFPFFFFLPFLESAFALASASASACGAGAGAAAAGAGAAAAGAGAGAASTPLPLDCAASCAALMASFFLLEELNREPVSDDDILLGELLAGAAAGSPAWDACFGAAPPLGAAFVDAAGLPFASRPLPDFTHSSCKLASALAGVISPLASALAMASSADD